MKKQITNYTFDKTAKTITFNDYTNIRLDSVLLITDVTNNKIIYNFANHALGGSVYWNVLYLTYDTTTMDNSDELQIFYDDTYVTDKKIIPAIDKINRGEIISSPMYYTTVNSDYTTAYYDLSNISVNSWYYYSVWDRVFFTSTNQFRFVKSINSSLSSIELDTPLDIPPVYYENIYIQRKIPPSVDWSWTPQVYVTNMSGGGGYPNVGLNGNIVTGFWSLYLDFSTSGQTYDLYWVDTYSEINFIIDDTGWQSWSQVYVLASANAGLTWQAVNCRDGNNYSNSYLYMPGWYTFDTAGFNAFRLTIGSSYPWHFAGVQFNWRPVGKRVQQVEMVTGLTGSFWVYQYTNPWTMAPYKSNIANTTTALAIGATYNSWGIYVASFADIMVQVFTLQDSAIDWVIFEGNNDNGSTWYPIIAPVKQSALVSGQFAFYRVPAKFQYFRMRYINGAVATSTPFSIRMYGEWIPWCDTQADTYGNEFTQGAFLPTYTACSAVFTPGSGALNDLIDIFWVANREVKIQKLNIWALCTTPTVTTSLGLIKKAAANSGGTSTSPTKVPVNSSFKASSLTLKGYTVSPSVVAGIGDIWREPVSIGTALSKIISIDFTNTLNSQPLTLNSALEGICLNGSGSPITGLQLMYQVVWTESEWMW